MVQGAQGLRISGKACKKGRKNSAPFSFGSFYRASAEQIARRKVASRPSAIVPFRYVSGFFADMSDRKVTIAFFRTVLLGGIAVLLPITLLVFFFKWLYLSTTELISPLTTVLVAQAELGSWLADLIVIALIVVVCFVTGFIVRTRIGGLLMSWIESSLFKSIPGYKLVKETVSQFVRSDRASPFSTVAVARLFGDDVMTTVFVTSVHENGYYTVFVPTGPNPTSGLMFHLPQEKVTILPDVSVETAMRSVIGCGIGAQPILKSYFS